MARHNDFTTIRTEGALLPPDLLRRLRDNDKDLPGLTPDAYHLIGHTRLSEAISEAWNKLQGAWATFQDARNTIPEGNPGTATTRDRWLLPLFQVLDYGRLQTSTVREVSGKTYPISHAWTHVPIHLVGCNIDLDTRTAGVAGAARQSPHGLVQAYLNATDDSLWGVVSNGLKIRLLRDNRALTRQAYLEFDLEAMLSGEVYPDFVLLYLTLHQSRLEADTPENTLLEQWTRAAQELGARALDRLRDGVQAALTTLGQGFLEHPANTTLRTALTTGTLTPQDYYRQLLRVVYRFLVLFAAEDRGLLHPSSTSTEAKKRYSYYSTRRLRDLADAIPGGRHPDQYRLLKRTWNWLGHDGAHDIAIPALGGFLFSDTATPDLDRAELNNGNLLAAVRHLAYTEANHTRYPIDYKNLGAEELGSVYESLLELQPRLDPETGHFNLETLSGNERKSTGSYYTPTSLIRLLLDSALDPVLERASAGAEPESSILGLRVLDPSCGSGHFLIVAGHRIAKRLAQVRTGDEEPGPDLAREALSDVISHCLYGVDLNDMAAELCKVALWLEALVPGRPLTFLDHHIKAGNSLLGVPPSRALSALIGEGLPDDAFQSLEDDDRSAASDLRRTNRNERQGAARLFASLGAEDPATSLARELEALGDASVGDIESVRALEEAYRRIIDSDTTAAAIRAADAYSAAFVWEKKRGVPRPITTTDTRDLLAGEKLPVDRQGYLDALKAKYRFFHWQLSFADVLTEHGGFDVVIGNPPYGALLGHREGALTKYRNPIASTSKNVAADFIEMASHLAAPAGRVGLVVPKSITFSSSWRPIRMWLKERVVAVVDVGKAWQEVKLEQVTIAYAPTPVAVEGGPVLGRLEAGSLMPVRDARRLLHHLESIPTGFTDADFELYSTMKPPSSSLLGDVCRTQRGTAIQRHVTDSGDIPVLGGRSISEFKEPLPVGYICEDLRARARLTVAPQVVFQNIVAHVTQPKEHIKLIGTVLEGEYACLDTVNLLHIHNHDLSPYALASYIMSDLVGWFVYVCLYNRAVRTMHFDGYILEQIPNVPETIAGELDELGTALRDSPTPATWSELNSTINRAFGIPEELGQELSVSRRSPAEARLGD